MEKLYFEDGKEVKIGDVVTFSTKQVDPIFGNVTTTISTIVTENNIKHLIDMGVLTIKEDKSIPLDITYFVHTIASKIGWSDKKMFNILNKVSSIHPIATFSILLREIALELDKKYEDHIKNSPNIFSISVLDGTICKVNKAKIKSYKHFSAFRSVEDAKIACRILSPLLKGMYAKE